MLKPHSTTILHFRLGERLLIISALKAFIMLTVLGSIYTAAAASEAIDTNDSNREGNRIRITSDKLEAEVNAGEIEFVGNVKAARADALITSDRLKIIYDPETIKKTGDIKGVTIKKIIANGHVKIVTDNIIAETDRAEYTIISKVLVLLGEQSKVSQGGHSITGPKFTLYRSEGKLIVESSREKRIKAILQPNATDR